jgi:putative redox protein
MDVLMDTSRTAEAGSDADIEVVARGGDSYAVTVRGHGLVVDQPVAEGGNDLGPTPTELFVVSLVTCVAHYAGRFLTRHGAGRDGLRVSARFGFASDRPARVGSVEIRLEVPEGLPAKRRDALLAVASHCTVHNTLNQPPDVKIVLI